MNLVQGVLLAMILLLVGAGCDGTRRQRLKDTDYQTAYQLQVLERAYRQHILDRGSPPKNWDALKGMTGEAKLEDLKVSQRDGQPFQVFWGTKINQSEPEQNIIAHEVEGAEGLKFVLTSYGVYTVDEEEFKKLVFPR